MGKNQQIPDLAWYSWLGIAFAIVVVLAILARVYYVFSRKDKTNKDTLAEDEQKDDGPQWDLSKPQDMPQECFK